MINLKDRIWPTPPQRKYSVQKNARLLKLKTAGLTQKEHLDSFISSLFKKIYT